MRRIVVSVVVVALVFALTIGVAMAESGNGNGKGNGKKVTICHKGKKTLRLPKKAAKAHLKRHEGDTPGPCRMMS